MLFPASGQASIAGPAVRKAHREKPENCRKTSSLVLSEIFRLFLCPEALFAPFKLQAQIVCYRAQAGSQAAFFAAFFPGKKARILPKFSLTIQSFR